jgi:hypothetical protein
VGIAAGGSPGVTRAGVPTERGEGVPSAGLAVEITYMRNRHQSGLQGSFRRAQQGRYALTRPLRRGRPLACGLTLA